MKFLFPLFFLISLGLSSVSFSVEPNPYLNTDQMIEFWQRALKKKMRSPNTTSEWLAGQIRFKEGDETVRFIEEKTAAMLQEEKPFKLSASKQYPLEKFSPADMAIIEEKINASKKEIARNLLAKIKRNAGRHSYADLVDYSTTFVAQIADHEAQAVSLLYDLNFNQTHLNNPDIKKKSVQEMIEGSMKKHLESKLSLKKQTLGQFPYMMRVPDHRSLDFVDFNLKTGLPIYPLGVVDKTLHADGYKMVPTQFYFHDISHTFAPMDVLRAELDLKKITPQSLDAFVKKTLKFNKDVRKLIKAMDQLDPLNRTLFHALLFFTDHEAVPIRINGVDKRPFSNLDELKKRLDFHFGKNGVDLDIIVRRLNNRSDLGYPFKKFKDFGATPELIQNKINDFVKLIDSVEVGYPKTSPCSLKQVLSLIMKPPIQ